AFGGDPDIESTSAKDRFEGGANEGGYTSSRYLPDLSSSVCELQIGSGRKEARGCRTQELHDEVREGREGDLPYGCSGAVGEGRPGQKAPGRGQGKRYEEGRRRWGQDGPRGERRA